MNPAGHSPGGDTARPSSGVAARRTADCVSDITLDIIVSVTENELQRSIHILAEQRSAESNFGQSLERCRATSVGMKSLHSFITTYCGGTPTNFDLPCTQDPIHVA